MNALAWLAFWCASGALVGWLLVARSERGLVGSILGAFMGIFGWVLILGAQPRASAREPFLTPDDVPAGASDESFLVRG